MFATLLALCLPWLSPAQPAPASSLGGAGAGDTSDIVRRDGLFRESLAAIRDWEAVLAAAEKEKGPAAGVPVLPVPEDGSPVVWPNPFPRALLPGEDLAAATSVRWAGGEAEVTRSAPGREAVREAAKAGDAALGYKHPGGGGKDHWYHHYHRRFDRLGTFRPRPAPFALEVAGAPLDLRRGANEVAIVLRNASASRAALALDLRWTFASPGERRAGGSERVELPAGEARAVRFPVDLRDECGGLLVLEVEVEGAGEGAGGPFWLPLLTHVERVSAVLDGVEQILGDVPDARGAERLAALRRRAVGFEGGGRASPAWRELFEEASALRDEILLARIDFDALLFVKRKPFDSEQPFMDAHHLRNRPGGAIYRLSPVRPGGEVMPVVDSLGEGVYRDLCLRWDAKRFLFAFGNGSDKWDGAQSYHIYEAAVDGTGLRQLTFGPKNDCEPFYLPSGQIGFTSDRSEHFVMCGGDRHSPSLFVMEGDGSGVRQLSFNVFNDFNPTVLPDGSILYGRWEYNERSVTSLHKPFTIRPDGTMVAPYYGNATIRPNVVMFPRPVPGSDKVMGLFTAHHGQTHGPIGLIDAKRGVDGPGPLTVLTPGVPVTGEKAEESFHGWHSDPWPLSEGTYLSSFTPTAVPWLEASWALYAGDRHGNLALVHRDPRISEAEPVPLAPRPVPPALLEAPPDTDAADAEATLIVLDVHEGLPGVARGTPRYLRVLEDVPRKGVGRGGVICTSGTSIYTVKRVLGVVPLDPDGSAHFTVPANRNVYFEVLDAERREVQRMRSVVCLKPRETRTCVGCHAPVTNAPPNRTASAPCRAASRPEAPPWGGRTLSFLRDVQPLLDARCTSCHSRGRKEAKVILSGDLTDQFSIGYEELLPYVKAANAMRWDLPEDVLPRPPYTYGSGSSPLAKLLEAGHQGVELSAGERDRLWSWIDSNAVYYDRYETGHYPNRHVFTGKRREKLEAIHARRCASCHPKDDGRGGTWWLSVDWREPAKSRALQAPLAAAAGGWGSCGEGVFATAGDPDYEVLASALRELGQALAERPREDLASLR
ncbi:MAG: hypothetical protein HY721_26065 [Planctomycetes bacterium]|nr:hypothetical protein [Planctomycetota bacterium]